MQNIFPQDTEGHSVKAHSKTYYSYNKYRFHHTFCVLLLFLLKVVACISLISQLPVVKHCLCTDQMHTTQIVVFMNKEDTVSCLKWQFRSST